MRLPELILPQIDLPFQIPLLAHPYIVHFLIALPIIVLILELLNLIMKKKAVGGVSFFLLLLSVIVAIGAYFSLLVDSADASATLNKVGQDLLLEHSLLGTYLMLGAMLLLLLKLFAFTGNTLFKSLYILGLIALVVGALQYAKEANTLVYQHGMNVIELKVHNENLTKLNILIDTSKTQNNTLLLELKTIKSELENVKKALKQSKVAIPVLAPTGVETNDTLIQNHSYPNP